MIQTSRCSIWTLRFLYQCRNLAPSAIWLANFCSDRGIARHSEFKTAGITAATISRMLRDDEVTGLRGASISFPMQRLMPTDNLAEAAKRVPKGVICLASALAFHGITDQLPHAVWMAIGMRDWAPKVKESPIRIVRFTDAFLTDDVITDRIEGVPVKIFGVAKTIADCFRHRRTVGQSIALGRDCGRRSGNGRPRQPKSHA